MKTKSELYSLADIVAQSPTWYFNIPIYQRLYVWNNDQVLTLLNDLINAYERGEEIFFLGGMLLVEQKHDHQGLITFDLIDGQQRFTTLWLLCHVWRGSLEKFLAITDNKQRKPRLQFAIRPDVNNFMLDILQNSDQDLSNDMESTKRMRNTLELMNSIFEKRDLPKGISKEGSLTALADFVYNQVKFVITTVPTETDLNKLFEVINNRGVQLQHHEILKAKLLEALPESERMSYAVLWEACADMDNFVESNLKSLSKLAAHQVTAIYESGKLVDSHYVLNQLDQNAEGKSSLSLLNILTQATDEGAIPDPNPIPDEKPWTRSMLGFPLFLQHTLRIWLHEHSLNDLPRLLDKELLKLFEPYFSATAENKAEKSKSFIELLWRLRVLFDQHIIKWADQGEEEIHLISAISVSMSNNNRYMSRSRGTDSHRAFALLQSMLYHSQEITTQYWVTPLLLFIHKNPHKEASYYFDYLRHLDNYLLGSEADASLVVRTRSFMDRPWQKKALAYPALLEENLGVKFPHYWFYKLEFVLWYLLKDARDEKWKKFRLTAKSSVEHISPQTPTSRDENRVKDALDDFGNLALVSRSLNSEYGNLPYNEKRQRFLNKNNKMLDSLKMALIYKNEQWSDEIAFSHQAEMIRYLDDYYALPNQALLDVD